MPITALGELSPASQAAAEEYLATVSTALRHIDPTMRDEVLGEVEVVGGQPAGMRSRNAPGHTHLRRIESEHLGAGGSGPPRAN